MAGSIDEAREWMALAEQTLEATQALLEKGFYRDVLSRAYYAMFYAAKGAISSEGIQASKHSAVIAAFGRSFAKTGRLPVHLHRMLIDAFDDREAADYGLVWEATKEDAEQRMRQAEEFVFEVKKMLF